MHLAFLHLIQYNLINTFILIYEVFVQVINDMVQNYWNKNLYLEE